MGAITRGVANGITTSGVVLKSIINNDSMDNVTAFPSGIPADSITFISSQTASNSASLSFTSGLTSTYKAYKFVFGNIHARTDNVPLEFNFSTNGGSTYAVTKTSTFFRSYHAEDDSATSLGYQGAFDLAQSTSYQAITNGLGNGADESGAGTLIIFNPSSTTYVKHYIGRSIINEQSDLCMEGYSAGYANTTSAINAIQFRMSSGNMDGTIYMYGIK
jgi:hypothetical protein